MCELLGGLNPDSLCWGGRRIANPCYGRGRAFWERKLLDVSGSRCSSFWMKQTPLLLFLLFAASIHAQNPDADTSVAGNDQVADIIKNYGGRGTLSDGSDPTPAEQAVKEFKVREGFDIELMASEPEVGAAAVYELGFEGGGCGWCSICSISFQPD